MAKIVFTELEGWENEYIRKALPDHQLVLLDKPLSKEDHQSIAEAEIIAPFVYSPINSEVIEAVPSLKFIATRSTGYDHVDLKAAAARGIVVSNVPFYGENTVAEHAWALILALSRKICQSYDRTKKGSFSFEGLRGFDLKGKTLGVVGCGHIGEHVVRIAKAFEMKVLVFDPRPNEELASQMGFTYVSLEDLLKESDVITLHAPYNEKTHHLLNAENMKLIKKGAVLVNTARGGLVETMALVELLDSGQLAGAGLDVLEEENFIKEESLLLSPEFHKVSDYKTLIADHILLEKENVIITPHNAFNSQEAVRRILDTTLENINGYLSGKIINQVKV